MKKLFALLPLVAVILFMTGCADEDQPQARTYYAAPAYAPAPYPYYGDPYYVYGGVNYYNRGGRYYYYRGHNAVYVGGLPGGGYYWHGHGGRYYRRPYYRHY